MLRLVDALLEYEAQFWPHQLHEDAACCVSASGHVICNVVAVSESHSQ